jgi:class 3 adenylate cyclase
VLVCDLVGFTAAANQADPEEVQARLGPYHDRARREIERYGGTVEKFIGDAVVGVFGVPAAHEDDPERAVRAALDVVEAVERLDRASPGLGLAVRVAVTTGEAVVLLDAIPERGEHSSPATWPTPPPGCRPSPRSAGWWWGRRPSGRPAG